MKLGFADRDEYYADPRFAEVPLPELLSDEYTAVRKMLGNAASVRWLDSSMLLQAFESGSGPSGTCIGIYISSSDIL